MKRGLWLPLSALLICARIAGAQTPTHTITNAAGWQLGISTAWGGAITSLKNNGGSNLVDNGIPDPGRSIQLSFYQSADTFTDGWPCDGGTWGYNPTQPGTMGVNGFGQCTPVYKTATLVSSSSSSISTSTSSPWNWNYHLGLSNLVYNQTVSLVSGYDNVFRIDYSVTNNETFTVTGLHEAPVAYLTTALNNQRLLYGGSRPWTYDSLSASNQSGIQSTTEPWVGAFNSSDVGVALFEPDMPANGGNGSGFANGHPDGGTSVVLAGWRNITLYANHTKSWTAYLVVGTKSQIRDSIYRLSGLPTGPRYYDNATLNPDTQWDSADGRFHLRYQGDGNLVLYMNSTALWNTGTFGSAGHAVVQGDGHFVVYDSSNNPVWYNGVYGYPNQYMVIQDDGNVVVFSNTTVLWSTGTGGH